MRAVATLIGYALGALALGVLAIALCPFVVLWLLAAFVLDVADGGLLA